MVMARGAAWDERKVTEDGIVSVRDLSHHTTQVLKAVEESGRPVLVSRHGRVVASLAPTTFRHVVDQMLGSQADLRDSMTMADKTLEAGQTMPASKLSRD
jgi:prevent-host-death family protein